ncbi:hypothetical protein HRG_005769 [Hirsutella rhossiliensis]|uniref:Uncharacterized protein n=1 Tax=Hirsutella rhossiliensis TaxID=111463 RepID=A0A9P8SIJ8_9HYPO|nr:uncharacterized protein HRG_05769 [Hirsutella rhossiliensis]KAH0963259.1 hypothetical protein HRG_05769 [Hirsutella rhossiliensis]
MEMYAHKPLPPLPLNLRSSRPGSRSSAAPAESVSQLWGLRKASKTPDPEASRPRHAPAFGSCRTNSRRRSSYKVQQLTGYDVDIADDSPPDSDCSSVYSLEWADDGYHLVPVLEADSGDAPSSRGSSWAPMSPQSGPSGSPLNAGKPVIRSGSDASLGGLLVSSEVQRALGEEWMRRWDPSYGQFSDSKAAGEYHRIATEIAARHTGRSTRESPVPVAAAEARRKRPSLSVNFGSGAKFSPRRRNASHPVDPSSAAKQTSGTEAALPATPPSPQRTPVSAFDSDSSDGEARAAGGSGIREWFGRRSDEAGATADRPSPHVYWKGQQDEAAPRTSKAGEQVRELLHHAKDRARLLHMPREERRRGELRRYIRRIPC